MSAIEAVLCDLDGTLVDSEPYHLEAWNTILSREGHTPPSGWSEDCIGLPDSHTCEKVWNAYPDLRKFPDLLQMKQKIFRGFIARHGSSLVFPGVTEKLAEALALGIKLAIGTNSIMENANATLTSAGLAKFFPVVVSIDTVANGKPFPDIFAAAAERLGVPPERCAVIDDSVAGLQSGKTAGCLALGVASTWPAEKLTPAERVFRNVAAALAWVIAKGRVIK